MRAYVCNTNKFLSLNKCTVQHSILYIVCYFNYCVCVYTFVGALRDQKRTLDPLELWLPVAVSCPE